MTVLKLCFLMVIFLTTVSAHGICQMYFADVNSAVKLSANNFPTLDIRVEKQGECGSFYVSIDNGGGASYAKRALKSGQTVLPIQFYKDAGRTKILKDEFETSAAEVITGTFAGVAAATSQRLSYFPFVNSAAHLFARAGQYRGNFTLKLFEGSPAAGNLMDSKIVNFAYLQNPTADISVFDTDALAAEIVLMYNSGFAILISSLNNGRLKHTEASKYVRYQVKVDGVEKSISNVPTVIKSATGHSPDGGVRLPMQVVIGDVAASPPVNYSDIISIIVASRE